MLLGGTAKRRLPVLAGQAREVFDKLRQVGITCFPGADASQAQFLGQAILQGLVGPFDAPFGLRRAGADDLDVQLLHGAPKLRQGIRYAAGRLIDPEYAVLVAVEGGWLAIAAEIPFHNLAIAEKALALHEQQLYNDSSMSSAS